ncbi:MAG: hypothetical protein S0880_24800 [Actinomycetota bacterium]|nr:hypothetical protein [Actinomycetota bacterium]
MSTTRPLRRLLGPVLAAALVATCGTVGGDDDRLAAPSTDPTELTTTTATALDTSVTSETSTTVAPTTRAEPTTTTVADTTTTAAPTTVGPPTTAVSATGCPAVPAWPGLDPNRPRYTVTAQLDPARAAISGTWRVRFVPDLATSRIVLRLWPNGPRPAASGVSLAVGEFASDHTIVGVTNPDATTVIVNLAAELAPGEAVELTTTWQLNVPGATPDRWSRSGGALRIGSFVPLVAWEPGVGWALQPPTSGFAEAVSSPVADWDLTVSAPAGVDVLASGAPDGTGRWTAVGARDIALSAGSFSLASATSAGGVAVSVGVQNGIGESAQAYLNRVVAALDDFSRRFGAYPWPALSLAITPDLGGGIEFPMHIHQGPGTIGRTTPHEVAHQWFYGVVGNNQGRDPVLDEGLATYAEARHEGTIGAMESRFVPPDAQGHAGEPMSFWESRLNSYYRGVYVQGSNALSTLGDDALVDCALAHYMANNAWGIATQADLVAAMSTVFPNAPASLAAYGIAG